MKKIPFTVDNLDELLNLSNGYYLLLKDDMIVDLLYIVNTDDDGCKRALYNIASCCGSDELYSFEEYMYQLTTYSKYILINILEIKL